MQERSKKKRRQRGFSLIEILIAASILSVAGVAVYSTFSQGLRLWQRTVRLQPDLDSDILFEKMTDDLRRTYRNSEGLQGSDREIKFPAFSGRDPGTGQVEYRWNPEEGFLERRETGLRVLLSDEWGAEAAAAPAYRPVTEKVKGVRFEYYYEDPKKKSFLWKDFWKQKCLPRAVRISLQYDDLNKMEPKTRIIALPAGGCPVEAGAV